MLRPTPMAGTSREIVERLTARTELVAEGGFALDLAAAQDKLQAYRLADPQTFVLLLVEAAHLLPGCRQIEFVQTRRATTVTWRGLSLDDRNLREIVDATQVALGRDPREAALERRGLQVIGLALLALASVEHGGATLSSSAADEQLELEPGAKPRFGPRAEPIDGPALCLVVREPLASRVTWSRSRGVARHRADLLRARARYASLPVVLDGERISGGFGLAELTDPRVVRDQDQRLVGVIGLSWARTRATLLLVANGVLIEKVSDTALAARFLALVQASDLPRDLGLTKLLRGEAYRARLEQIRRAARSLAQLDELDPTPIHVPVSSSLTGPRLTVGLFGFPVAAIGLLALLTVLAGSGLAVPGAFGFGVGVVLMTPALQAITKDHVSVHGQPAIATVRACRTLEGRRQELDCLVHIPGGEPYPARVQTTGYGGRPAAIPGQRIHVRVGHRRRGLVLPAKRGSKELGIGE